MHIRDFNHTIDTWIKELACYDFVQLCAKPSPASWSLGQVYMHLIENVSYYREQILLCISTNDHAQEEASQEAKTMFLLNRFPDIEIEGPPENADTPQPESKEQLLQLLLNAKEEMNQLASQMDASKFHGKTRHPGLHYFNAHEWLQFADMHFRHHLRQKKRLDDFLFANDNPTL